MNKLLKFVFWPTVILTLQACTTVGPDYESPVLGEPQVSTEHSLRSVDRDANWWKHFGDPQVEVIVKLALTNNLSLKMAEANVKKALAVFEGSEDDHLPKGSLAASYTTQEQVQAGVGFERIHSDFYELGASLQWSADLFGKVERTREFLKANAEAELLALRSLQIDIVSSAMRAYGELKGLKTRIVLAGRHASIAHKTRAIVQSRFDLGYASKLDLHRADTQIYSVLADIPDLETKYQVTKGFLEALTGSEKPLQFLEIETLDARPLELEQPFAIGKLSDFLKYRPDVKSAERRLAAASASIGIRTADLYPDISIRGFLGYLTGGTLSIGSDAEAWRITPSVSWNIFDYGSIKANIKVASAEEEKAYAEFQRTTLNAIKEVEASLEAYANTQQRHQLLNAQFTSSLAAYELAKDLYETGAISLLDLLDAERQLLSVEVLQLDEKVKDFTSIVDVYKAFGGGFI